MRAAAGLALSWALLAGSLLAEPRLALEPQSHDFGRVRQGRLLRRTFTLSNFGSSELRLESIQGDCTCLRIEGPQQRSLAPGQSTTVVVVFGSRRYDGRVQRKLTVRSNDPVRPTLEVPVEATVVASK